MTMLENKEGQQIPQVTFKNRMGGQWVDTTTEELFSGKKVVVFSLPGAFTPTCSTSHVPRYNELAATFKEHGVDDIICVSVNDAFVMNEWQENQEAENITFIPDGNGEFTDKMGMLVDKEDLGFGKRSWRYSMLVNNGTIEKMFIEPDKPGDPFEVSDADTMLDYLDPNAKRPPSVAIFTKPGCPYCARAKDYLKEKGLVYSEIVVGKDVPARVLTAVAGKSSAPQVFANGKLIGGEEELKSYQF